MVALGRGSRRRARLLAGALALLGGPLAACKGCGSSSSQSAPVSRPPGTNPVPDRTVLPLLSILTSCDIDHRGEIVDMGTEMMTARVGRLLRPDTIPRSVEHDGATWAVLESKRTDVAFTIVEPTVLFASARILPRAAKNVAFYLDEQLLGVVRLQKGEARIVRTEPTALPVDAGAHTLSLRLSPGSKDEPLADVDWVRLGVPDELDQTFGAPTLADTVQERAALDKVPHRALAIRAPGAIRCPVRVPKEGVLRASLGVSGAGNQALDVIVRVDGAPPQKLLSAALTGGDGATWKDVEVPLQAFADQLVHLELRAPPGPSSSRVFVGDPELVVPTIPPPPVGSAQVVVIVVLDGVDRTELPGYTKEARTNLERLGRLTEQAVVFTDHRNPTTGVSSAMASMLTGLPPSLHLLTDPGDALPPSVETLFDVAHDASVATAFFTTVPQSFKPFGLSRGVEHVVELSPVSGDWHSPITDAATWIEQSLAAHPSGKLLVVVHSRGGHPPWAVSAKQLDSLPPADYSGNITPRRAGEQIAMLRRRKGHELPQSDFVRAEAMHEVGLVEEDHALGQLLDALEGSPAEDKALVIVTADSSSGMSTLFADDPPFEETSLAVPLYVVLPRHAYAGRVVDAPTEVADIARTALSSLELPPLRHGFGQDLASVASGLPPIALEPRVAESGARQRARWGTLALLLRPEAEPFLCDVVLDPTCAFDRRGVMPLATEALVKGFARRQEELAKLPLPTRAAANIDDATAAALRVWGSLQ